MVERGWLYRAESPFEFTSIGEGPPPLLDVARFPIVSRSQYDVRSSVTWIATHQSFLTRGPGGAIGTCVARGPRRHRSRRELPRHKGETGRTQTREGRVSRGAPCHRLLKRAASHSLLIRVRIIDLEPNA